jgi:hypothetical protein
MYEKKRINKKRYKIRQFISATKKKYKKRYKKRISLGA